MTAAHCRPKNVLMWVAMVVLALGCGDDSGGGDDEEETCVADVFGTVFGLEEGTATLRGTITLPPRTESRLLINLMVIEGSSAAALGVLPDIEPNRPDPCLEGMKTKGKSFTYNISNLLEGEYRLHLILKKRLDDRLRRSERVYSKSGVTVVTVADGATVTHDEIFPAGEEPSAEAPADEETATP